MTKEKRLITRNFYLDGRCHNTVKVCRTVHRRADGTEYIRDSLKGNVPVINNTASFNAKVIPFPRIFPGL
jgi:hypothetical protein